MNNSDISKIKNTFTALVTPFDEEGDVEKEVFRTFVRRQIKAGVGLVPMGTTGESSTLSYEEHENMIKWAVEEDSSIKRKTVCIGRHWK